MCFKYRVDWVSKYGKMDEKHTFWAIFGDVYRYTLNMYRYTLHSGRFWPMCTGTHMGCTGTPYSGFPVLTSFRIVAKTCSFLIRFE